MTHSQYMLFFTVTTIYIACHLMGSIIKQFYHPTAYVSNFKKLFPSHSIVAIAYSGAIFEIPYLVFLDRTPDALLYSNLMGVAFYSAAIASMMHSYFMHRRKLSILLIVYYLPLFALAVTMTAMLAVDLHLHSWIVWTAVAMSVAYLLDGVRMLVIIYRRVREQNRDQYSNVDDFPINFARALWKGAPLTIYAATFICLLSNDYYVKCVRDILFVGLSIGFVIYTLNPHRTGIDKVAPATAKRRLSDRRAAELEADIDELIVAKRLYTDPNLTIDRIAAELSSNANYVSEAIGYGNYGSFYNMINSIRVEQAARILQADKTAKLESVAYDCGFSSASVFSRIFKRIKGVSPSEFLKS